MLVVAPVALAVIGVLVAAMVSMVGDTIISNSRATTAYDLRDSLNRIEADARISINFMDTYSFFTSPQGKDGGMAPFTSSSGDLILTQQATTASPYDGIRDLVHYDGQATDCTKNSVIGGALQDVSSNRVLLNRVVYFLQTNPDGTKSLWRRVILRSTVNAVKSADTTKDRVCEDVWQRNTCSLNKVAANAICQTSDEKMIDNVKDFKTTYLMPDGTTAGNPADATSIQVELSVERKVAGATVSQKSSLQVARINDIPIGTFPTKPAISILNQAISTYFNPTTITFTWSASSAQSYGIQWKIGSGDWLPAAGSEEMTTDTTKTITTPPHSTVSIRVSSYNDVGKSETAQYDTETPLMGSMDLSNGWSAYSYPGGVPAPSNFTKTSAGVVVLNGLVRGGSNGSIITTLPNGYRPYKNLTFEALAFPNIQSRIDVDTSGNVIWRDTRPTNLPSSVSTDPSQWVSLDNVRFLTSPASTWTDPTLVNGWTSYGGGWGPASFNNDSLGRTFIAGTVATPSTYPPASGSQILTYGSTFEPKMGSSGQTGIFAVNASNAFGMINVAKNSLQFRAPATTAGWQAYNLLYPNTTSPDFTDLALQNGYQNYSAPGTNGHTPASFYRYSDGLVVLRGVLVTGSRTIGTAIATLPPGSCTSSTYVFATFGTKGDTDADAATASGVPVQPARISVSGCTISLGSNTNAVGGMLGLDGISFIADQ